MHYDLRKRRGIVVAVFALSTLLLATATSVGKPATPTDQVSAVSGEDAATYQQQLRPQFHFSPASTFTNDPNGLVFYRGQYHLFYQQRLFTGLPGSGLSCCDWGHAVSRDLMHWKQRPVAISRVPEGSHTPEEAIYSGSAVVDWGNTSGFGSRGRPPLVAIYTIARPGHQSQGLAYSLDDGRTWTKYAENPVLDEGSSAFRDPKVFWYEPLQRWTMVIWGPGSGIRWYTSPNLKDWTYRSQFDTGFEVPDFFPLALDGDPRRQKWVLFVANGEYWVGDFDGVTFTPDTTTPTERMDYGQNYYAALTYSNTPGRRVLVGWISPGFRRSDIWLELPWMGAMTVARELSLKTIDGKPQIVTKPVAEVRRNVEGLVTVANKAVPADSVTPLHPRAQGNQLDIEVTIEPGRASQTGLRVLAGQGLYTTIGYDAQTNEVYIDRSHSGRQDGLGGRGFTGRVALPAEARGDPVKLRVLVDRSTLEVYADRGTRVLSANVFPLLNTTMSSDAEAGTTSLEVQSTTGFQASQTLRVNADVNGPREGMQEYTVTDVSPSAISIEPALSTSWPAGTPASTAPAAGVEVFAEGGSATVTSARIWRMRSIWPDGRDAG